MSGFCRFADSRPGGQHDDEHREERAAHSGDRAALTGEDRCRARAATVDS